MVHRINILTTLPAVGFAKQVCSYKEALTCTIHYAVPRNYFIDPFWSLLLTHRHDCIKWSCEGVCQYL